MKPFAAAIPAALLLFVACQAPTLHSGPDTKDLRLSFLVSGARQAGTVQAGARLVLPTAQTLTVTLTPADATKAALVCPAAISAAGQTTDLYFPALPLGNYGIAATAATTAGAVLFQQSSTLAVNSSGSASATLNLVPADASSLTALDLETAISDDLPAHSSLSWRVRRSAMNPGPAWLALQGATESLVQLYVQDQRGAQLNASSADRAGALPTDADGDCIVTLYNPDADPRHYAVILTATAVASSWTTETPAVKAVALGGDSTVYFGVPATFSATYSGTASGFAWYIDGTAVNAALVSSGSASSSATTLPSAAALPYGGHTVTAVATDAATGIGYSASKTITATNNVPGATGLVGEWLFKGGALDSSGNGDNGTAGAAASLTQSRASAGGSNSYIELASCPLPGGTATPDPYTISVWIKTDLAPNAAANGQNIFLQCIGYDYSSYGNVGNVGFGLLKANTISYWGYTSSYAVPQGTWTHIVLVRSAGTLTLYGNGVQDSQHSGAANYTYSPPVVQAVIGHNGKVNNDWDFIGAIDDLRIYNRALTQAEITALANE